jgi:ectoine hydroxylase-related dioxygenase (phytanoyl-CoA dioxygenase family)
VGQQEQLSVALDQDQVEFFRVNGFLAIDRITTDDEVEWLKGVYDELFQARAGEKSGMYFDLGGRRGKDERDVLPQILAPERHRPELAETIYARNARRLGAQLLGVAESDLQPSTFTGHMIFKPPGYGRDTPWHQDEAYWDPTLVYRSVSAWMPLDPATKDSGCMQFIPGSHLGGVRRHRHVDDDPLVHALVTDDVDPAEAVACPIPVGGATFHHCRVLHYAGPNITDAPRRAYIQVQNAPPVENPAPDERPWQVEEVEALARLDR